MASNDGARPPLFSRNSTFKELNVRRKSPSTFLIAGLGSIGRRHLSIVRNIVPDAKIIGLELAEYDRSILGDDDISIHHEIESVLAENIDAAIIANPAPFHVETAQALAERGVDLFIEKPLSDVTDGISNLIDTCRAGDLVLQVGYCLRFEPTLACLKDAVAKGGIGRVISLFCEVGQYLPDWRKGTDYRKDVSARKDMGGGVLLELSHEIDYARWICGEIASISANINRLGDLEIDVEDHADLLVGFENGAFGQIHINMIQRCESRSCKVIGAEGTVEWDGVTNATRLFHAGRGDWETISPDATDTMDTADDIYERQFKDFIRCVETGAKPLVGGQDGLRVVETIRAARRSAREERKVLL